MEALTNKDIGEWDIYQASRELRQAWDQKSIRNGMKVTGKGRITCAAFAAEPRFDGMGPEGSESNPFVQSPNPTTSADSSQTWSTSQKCLGTETTQKEGSKWGQKKTKKPCWGCGGAHPHFQYVLISGHNLKDIQVPSECRKTFDEKMKNSAFAEKIRII